jgi:hypothetical protein
MRRPNEQHHLPGGQGRRCRDTFLSLKQTCRKLSISSWRYLQDRTSRKQETLPLSEFIRQAVREA